MTVLPLLALLGTVFGLLGGTTAFIIIYTKYQRHGFTGRQLLGEALRAGVIAVLVLLGSALAAGLVISRLGQRL